MRRTGTGHSKFSANQGNFYMRFFKLLHERNHIVVNIFGLKIKYRKPSVYERMYCSNPEIKHKRAIIFAIYDKNGSGAK